MGTILVILGIIILCSKNDNKTKQSAAIGHTSVSLAGKRHVMMVESSLGGKVN